MLVRSYIIEPTLGLITIRPVDNMIINYLQTLTDLIAVAAGRFGAVIVLSPIFSIPGTLLAIVGWYFGRLYSRAQLVVKREQSNARAPILGHISAAIAGLGTCSDVIPAHLMSNIFLQCRSARTTPRTRSGKSRLNVSIGTLELQSHSTTLHGKNP